MESSRRIGGFDENICGIVPMSGTTKPYIFVNDFHIKFVACVMHQIGQLYGLFHSGEGRNIYGDNTSYMGATNQIFVNDTYNASVEDREMCYNGLNGTQRTFINVDRPRSVQLS